MPRYAHYIDSTHISFPDFSQPPFCYIPNPDKNDSILRKNGYYPLTNEPQPIEGKVAILDSYHLREATKMVTRSVQVTVTDYDEEGNPCGEHQEWREQVEEVDDSSIEVTNSHYEDIPTPPPIDTTDRDNAEKAIVACIKNLAQKYSATADIEQMQDLTIPALKELATRYNVTAEDMIATMTEIQLQVLQLEAVEGGDWATCWSNLKSRFAIWWSQIN